GAEIQRFRAGREPHPGPALPARGGRPRHRAGPGRQRPRRSVQPAGGDPHVRGARAERTRVSRRDTGRPTDAHRLDADGFRREAKKSLGQNFLHDRGVIEKIVLAIDPRPGDRIVEIGPGQGALTLPLLDRHGAVTAIEFDRDLLQPLAAAARSHGELTLLNANVLDVDFSALAMQGGGELRLVGNLPYNLSSPILFHALDHAASIRDMHFMLQKEVVERMAVGPGSKVYGRLSVMLQAYCRVTPLFKVPPGAFRPAPKVDS